MADSELTVRDVNQRVIAEFRANGGKVGGQFERDTLLLLTTTGGKTGERRTTPVACVPDSGRILIVASNGGGPTNPDWYRNLVANPRVTVEVGIETYQAIAIPLQGVERDRAWARVERLNPAFGEYQAKTFRVIPVIAIVRRKS